MGARTVPMTYVEDSSYLMVATNFLKWDELQIGRFDFNGNLIHQKSYEFTSVGIVSTNEKCLEKNKQSYYSAQTLFYPYKSKSGDSLVVAFMKLNQNLDTIYTREFLGFQGAEPQILDMVFDTDSTFMVSGILYRETGTHFKQDLWVGRFDTNFVALWEKRIEDNYPTENIGYEGNDISIDTYGSVIVSGKWRGQKSTLVDVKYRSFAARLDRETGHLHWLKEMTGPVGSQNMAALDAGNGEYAFAQTQILNFWPNSYLADTTRIRYGKLDTLGNVVWDTLYQSRREAFWFTDMQKTLDGNYYLAGEADFPLSGISSGFKFSPVGDSLWYRYYYHQDTTDESYIWSFAPTPDTGFVHFGIFLDFDNDYDPQRIQYSWLLKTDKYGCEVEGCESIGLEEWAVKSPKFELYPNPAKDHVILQWDWLEVGLGEVWDVEITDIQGRIVEKYTILNLEHQEQRIPLGSFSPGAYMLSIKQSQQNIFQSKLLIKP